MSLRQTIFRICTLGILDSKNSLQTETIADLRQITYSKRFNESPEELKVQVAEYLEQNPIGPPDEFKIEVAVCLIQMHSCFFNLQNILDQVIRANPQNTGIEVLGHETCNHELKMIRVILAWAHNHVEAIMLRVETTRDLENFQPYSMFNFNKYYKQKLKIFFGESFQELHSKPTNLRDILQGLPYLGKYTMIVLRKTGYGQNYSRMPEIIKNFQNLHAGYLRLEELIAERE